MNPPKRVRNFTNCRVRFDSFKDVRHQIDGASGGDFQTLERGMNRSAVASCARTREIFDLSDFDGRIARTDRNLLLLIGPKLIYSDNDALFFLDRLLIPVRRLVDLALDPSTFDRRQHTSGVLDPLYILRDFVLYLVCQRLDRVRTAEGIDSVNDARLMR